CHTITFNAGTEDSVTFTVTPVTLGDRQDGPLFTTEAGRRWTQPEVWKHLRVLARRAGIPQAATIKPHTLRHQFITDNLANGVPLQDVQDAVSHSDPFAGVNRPYVDPDYSPTEGMTEQETM
ncbi:tyrosine-type recombinase/integrase, partial [Streptomyces sp. NRRL S-1896]|uniref:tyrosine-type recombinase/integrase n=1 Tax=Streptomyces sp. NRRL S-1896 TaxID=1463893 RepID=UPI0004CDA5B4